MTQSYRTPAFVAPATVIRIEQPLPVSPRLEIIQSFIQSQLGGTVKVGTDSDFGGFKLVVVWTDVYRYERRAEAHISPIHDSAEGVMRAINTCIEQFDAQLAGGHG